MNRADSIIDLIGKTPLVKLSGITDDGMNIWGKLEFFNPGGSVKDRIALSMIEDGEKKGLLKEGSIIVEPTSGNTGIGIAMVSAVKGYRTILIMPESASIERRKLMKAYGAEIILTPGEEGMNGAIARSEELAAEMKNVFIPGQFKNSANPAAHYSYTAEEILQAMDNNFDIFIAGAGTGGTLSGTAKRLKEVLPELQVIAVEPDDSAVISGDKPGPHKIQGIGAGFIPDNLDLDIISEVVRVTNQDAIETSRKLMSCEGILAGISSGAAAWAALNIAGRSENRGKKIVFIVPDTGERYLSTPLFD